MNQKNIAGGALGGLVAGIVFGMLSQMMGMMPMIAMLVHSQSVAVGWVVHLILSVVGGIVFVAVFNRLVQSYAAATGYGLLYGMVWWFFGMLIAMPLLLGMPTEVAEAFSQTNLMSLMGHAIWGILLGLVVVWYAKSHSGASMPERH